MSCFTSSSACNGEDKIIPQTECWSSPTIMSLPNDLRLNTFLKLDTESIKNVRLVCRSFRNLTNEPFFWRELLIRDFGKEMADAHPSQRCKEAYIEKYNKAKDFLKSLPHSDKFPLVIVYGRLLPKNFDSYIGLLSQDELRYVFALCAGFGFTPIMEAIIHHSRFSDISVIYQ